MDMDTWDMEVDGVTEVVMGEGDGVVTGVDMEEEDGVDTEAVTEEGDGDGNLK